MRIALMLALVAAACNGDGGHDAADGSVTDGSANDGSANDASVQDAGVNDAGHDSGVGLPNSGKLATVEAASIIGVTPQFGEVRGLLSAGFIDQSCVVQASGACTYSDCSQSQLPNMDGGPPSLGTIIVSGGSQTLTATPSYYYAATMPDMPLFHGGETLNFSATGGTVGAFTAQVTAPAPAQATWPPLVLGVPSMTTVPRSSDLVVTWTGGSGLFHFQLSTNGRPLDCYFPASDSHGTVPAVLLARLSAGDAAGVGYTLNFVTVPDGDWIVTVAAVARAAQSNTASTSGEYVGLITLQ